MKRLYEAIFEDHFADDSLMCFISGPRQVGKTTTSRKSAEIFSDKTVYLNWDDEDHREILLQGPAAIIEHMKIDEISEHKPILILDEIHKRSKWKNFLKGLYDTYSKEITIIVTGSSRLNTYKKGGDSLMGRYFSYRMHPLSIAECLHTDIPSSEIRDPQEIEDSLFQTLWKFGGFPKPFEKNNQRFHTRRASFKSCASLDRSRIRRIWTLLYSRSRKTRGRFCHYEK